MGNVFFLKGLIGIIQTTASTGSFDAWLRPTPYILTMFAAGGAVCGHMFMRKGLGEYKGIFMVTIFEGAHITAACLSGCIVMEEMVGAPAWKYILYWVSVSIIVAGMLVINMAAENAQIEGKFHIAQSFPESSQDEQPQPARNIGRGLEDHDLEALAPLPDNLEDNLELPQYEEEKAMDLGQDKEAFEIDDEDLKDAPSGRVKSVDVFEDEPGRGRAGSAGRSPVPAA